MLVKELIKLLESVDPDSELKISTRDEYGDNRFKITCVAINNDRKELVFS